MAVVEHPARNARHTIAAQHGSEAPARMLSRDRWVVGRDHLTTGMWGPACTVPRRRLRGAVRSSRSHS